MTDKSSKCCLFCEYGKIRPYSIECRNEKSLYFETYRRKHEKCPEFKPEKREKEQ